MHMDIYIIIYHMPSQGAEEKKILNNHSNKANASVLPYYDVESLPEYGSQLFCFSILL